jgi:predicted nuclease with RNAse H fold
MTERFVGIDVGQRALHAVMLQEAVSGPRVTARQVFAPDDMGALVEWCGRAPVALDAPLGPSTAPDGAHASVAPKFRHARCAEVALGVRHRIWVPWPTPRVVPAASWMAVGMAAATALEAGGHDVLETYPHGVFRRLAAGAPLPRKTTVDGRRARARLLAAAGVRGVTPNWGHDSIDAAGCALVSHRYVHRRAEGVTCGHDTSVMWLPEVTDPSANGGHRP